MFYVMREEIKIIIYDYTIGGSRWVQGTKKEEKNPTFSRGYIELKGFYSLR